MIPTPAMVQTFKRAWKTADTLGLEGERTKIALQAALENIYPTFPTMFHAVNGRSRWGGGAVMLFSKAGEGKTTELARAAAVAKYPLILLNSPAASFRERFAAVSLDELPAGAHFFGVKALHDVHEALDSGPGDEYEYIFVDTADMVATPLYAFQSLDAFAQARGITIFATGKLSRDHVAGNPLPVAAGVAAAEVRVHGFPCIIGGRA